MNSDDVSLDLINEMFGLVEEQVLIYHYID